MKVFIHIALGVLFGVGLGYLYACSIYEDRNEDIVKREITLLNQYTNPPSCEELIGHHDSLIQKSEGGNHVFWSYVRKDKSLKKIVISSDFIVAYETIEKTCE